ncbi:MAG: hypothetical protein O3A95_09885 [Planctomycetota bacterium]|nr:hypothetical protein [Planctomycetota bacterium]
MKSRTLFWWTWALLGMHVLWMVVRFALGFPIWGDEAFVVNNFPGLSYAELFEPLPNGQVAPLLWLWLEKLFYDLGDGSIYWLRFPALLAGLLSTWLMLRFCLRALPQPSALFAFAVFAASYYPLRHAVEVKPYALDLLFAVVQLNLALDLVSASEKRLRAKAIALVAVSVVGVWASYPSMFVSGGLALYFFLRKETRGKVVLGSLLLGVSAAAMVFTFALPHARAASWLMEMDMWTPTLPPLERIWTWPLWLVERHAGYMSAYPTGGRDYGSLVSLLLMVVGAIGLWRSRQRLFLVLLLGPLLFNFVAAAGKFYPYGGSIRVSIFMAPAFCLLMGHGLALATQRFKLTTQGCIGHIICLLLFSFATLGLMRDTQQPFKAEGDVRAKEFAAWIAEHAEEGDLVLGWCHQKDGIPDFHGLGGSMARLRVQLRQADIHVDWLNDLGQQGLVQNRTTGQTFWLLAYTDDNDTDMSFAEAEFQSTLESLGLAGFKMEHFNFPFYKAERVDLYRMTSDS